MERYHTTSEQKTEALAEQFARRLQAGDVIAYRGGLGAGKTAFTRGLARGLGARDDVSSPTFAICNEYRGGRLRLVHFDMYRVSDFETLEATGYYDTIRQKDVAYAVEWSENIRDALPEDAIIIEIIPEGPFSREITITGGNRF